MAQEREEHAVTPELRAGRQPGRPPGRFLLIPTNGQRHGRSRRRDSGAVPRAVRHLQALWRRRALEEVDFACGRGTIHAVLGENGAGKSTLIKIIAGVVQPDEGSMRLAGETVRFATPRPPTRAGIVCIFQELSLMPDLSVADNICHRRPAAPLRPDRSARAAPPRRGAAGPRRLRGRQPAEPRRAICRCRAGRWSRSPRRSAASRSC